MLPIGDKIGIEAKVREDGIDRLERLMGDAVIALAKNGVDKKEMSIGALL